MNQGNVELIQQHGGGAPASLMLPEEAPDNSINQSPFLARVMLMPACDLPAALRLPSFLLRLKEAQQVGQMQVFQRAKQAQTLFPDGHPF